MGKSTEGGIKTDVPAHEGHVSESIAHISAAWCVLEFAQGATFSLNVTEVQFDARNHDLGTTAAQSSESYQVTADEWRR